MDSSENIWEGNRSSKWFEIYVQDCCICRSRFRWLCQTVPLYFHALWHTSHQILPSKSCAQSQNVFDRIIYTYCTLVSTVSASLVSAFGPRPSLKPLSGLQRHPRLRFMITEKHVIPKACDVTSQAPLLSPHIMPTTALTVSEKERLYFHEWKILSSFLL